MNSTTSSIGKLALVTALCTVGYPCAAASPNGSTVEKIVSGGLAREFRLFVPPYTFGDELPLLVVLHGGFMDAAQTEELTGFTKLAAKRRFVVVYPAGVERHWNDGRESETLRSLRGKPDDVRFIRDLVGHLLGRYPVDRHRIFATGPSNGGMMSFRLGCEASDLFAGIAPVIASLPTTEISRCRTPHPLSVVMINGTKDSAIPYEGGAVMTFGRKTGNVMSVEGAFAHFAKANRCSGELRREIRESRSRADRTSLEILRFPDCAERTNTVLYTIVGGGHRWPGRDPLPPVKRLLGRVLGVRSEIIDASETIWEELSRTAKTKLFAE